jgi:hypothetical protein
MPIGDNGQPVVEKTAKSANWRAGNPVAQQAKQPNPTSRPTNKPTIQPTNRLAAQRIN